MTVSARILLFFSCVLLSLAFQPHRSAWHAGRMTAITGSQYGDEAVERDESVLSVMGDSEDCQATPDSSRLHRSLRDRIVDVERGAGRRYRCRTRRGFLNVHEEPGDPYDTDNIVGRLREGDIVTSTAPHRGPWIRHDGGGWSVSVFGGFTWLEALQE